MIQEIQTRPSYSETIRSRAVVLQRATAERTSQILQEHDTQQAFTWFGFETEQDFRKFHTLCRPGGNDYRSFMLFLIEDPETGAIAGSCNYHLWNKEHARAEVGYMVQEPYRQRGLARAALSLVLQYGFELMELNRVEAFVGPHNTPSLRLMNHFGFVREGQLREHYRKGDRVEDSVCFSILKKEYDTLKHAWQ